MSGDNRRGRLMGRSGLAALGVALMAGASALVGAPSAGQAQEVTLKVHHFLPPPSTTHRLFIEPWAKRLETQSNGRIKVEIYPAMQLGGKPPQLFDQVRDGIADVVWTLPGYTRGRFPVIEAFELPFMISTAEATSQAVQEYYETYAREEFSSIHPLMFHVHARGVIHTREKPITSLSDFKGLKLRAPTRLITSMVEALGATAVGMPVPAVPQALSKGVVDGTVIPWEVTVPLKVYELTKYHTTFDGPRGFYTSIFLFGMNKNTYEGMSDDLKKVIDDNSGLALAKEIGALFDQVEQPGIDKATERGNEIFVLSPTAAEEWRKQTSGVADRWAADMDSKGKDGKALVKAARDLVAKYSD
ncbi:MAG: TRAP transporter substrate-binding protein [Pseudomonadota bacterium]